MYLHANGYSWRLKRVNFFPRDPLMTLINRHCVINLSSASSRTPCTWSHFDNDECVHEMSAKHPAQHFSRPTFPNTNPEMPGDLKLEFTLAVAAAEDMNSYALLVHLCQLVINARLCDYTYRRNILLRVLRWFTSLECDCKRKTVGCVTVSGCRDANFCCFRSG